MEDITLREQFLDPSMLETDEHGELIPGEFQIDLDNPEHLAMIREELGTSGIDLLFHPDERKSDVPSAEPVESTRSSGSAAKNDAPNPAHEGPNPAPKGPNPAADGPNLATEVPNLATDGQCAAPDAQDAANISGPSMPVPEPTIPDLSGNLTNVEEPPIPQQVSLDLPYVSN